MATTDPRLPDYDPATDPALGSAPQRTGFRPGVIKLRGLSLNEEQAGDIADALEEAFDDLSYRAKTGVEYADEDLPAIHAKLERWTILMDRVAKLRQSLRA